jgi:hypothetical protein
MFAFECALTQLFYIKVKEKSQLNLWRERPISIIVILNIYKIIIRYFKYCKCFKLTLFNFSVLFNIKFKKSKNSYISI